MVFLTSSLFREVYSKIGRIQGLGWGRRSPAEWRRSRVAAVRGLAAQFDLCLRSATTQTLICSPTVGPAHQPDNEHKQKQENQDGSPNTHFTLRCDVG